MYLVESTSGSVSMQKEIYLMKIGSESLGVCVWGDIAQ